MFGLNISRGIVKKAVEGELYPYSLKELGKDLAFPLSLDAMKYHEIAEGDIVEYSGSTHGDFTFLAISGVVKRMELN